MAHHSLRLASLMLPHLVPVRLRMNYGWIRSCTVLDFENRFMEFLQHKVAAISSLHHRTAVLRNVCRDERARLDLEGYYMKLTGDLRGRSPGCMRLAVADADEEGHRDHQAGNGRIQNINNGHESKPRAYTSCAPAGVYAASGRW